MKIITLNHYEYLMAKFNKQWYLDPLAYQFQDLYERKLNEYICDQIQSSDYIVECYELPLTDFQDESYGLSNT